MKAILQGDGFELIEESPEDKGAMVLLCGGCGRLHWFGRSNGYAKAAHEMMVIPSSEVYFVKQPKCYACSPGAKNIPPGGKVIGTYPDATDKATADLASRN